MKRQYAGLGPLFPPSWVILITILGLLALPWIFIYEMGRVILTGRLHGWEVGSHQFGLTVNDPPP